MRKSGFYARLAARNMRKNGKYYLPYLLTGIGAVAMFYTMFFLSGNRGIDEMRGAQYVLSMLFLGTGVIGIFSAILLFYTNSFLMKRRKMEIGLYNILGMEKRHIGRFLLWETVYTSLICVAGGLAVGVLFSKLMLLLLCAILHAAVPFGFFVSVQGMFWTAAVFFVIFLLCLLHNLRGIGKAKPIELLHATNASDRQPKTRWVLAVIGTLTLAAGYVIAVTVKSPLSALGLFFIAVLLVIAGTYCLFTAGSIAVLKALRANKKYYYRTKHFTAVSGMLHRMNRNAAGLATVCILSTMVLVTISTTVCLYVGTEEIIERMYPRDVQVFMFEGDERAMNAATEAVQKIAHESGMEITNIARVRYYFGANDLSANQSCGDALKVESDGGVIWEEYADEGELPTVYVGFDIEGGEFTEDMNMILWDSMDSGKVTFKSAYVTTRAENTDELYGAYGGFFFIGLLLGFMFLMATALIIYYKQVSEGYEDAGGYKIMQQVGMSEKEVRESIRSQIITVFFLPLFAAAVHIAFAFNMITRMLTVFSLTNTGLFAVCCVVTFLVFAIIYTLIYLLTARSYYKIVKA